MSGSQQALALLVVIIGALIVAAIILRALLERTYVPALIGFMALGFLLRLADDRWHFLNAEGHFTFDVLQELGVIALLFRIGLESNLTELLRQLPMASVIWVGNVALSAVPGYLVAYHLLGFGLIPSLVVATALTATSIGVSVGMWRHHGALGTRKGQLLTDVAEMDDLSGVAFMALLFAVLPILRQAGGSDGELVPQLMATGGVFLVKLVLFAGACIAFARYAEERLTTTFRRFGSRPQLIALVAGIGILIAGVSSALGFSAALGALFAGLAFSRDPDAVKIDGGFQGLYHLLAPFFFIGIGLSLPADALASSLGPGLALLTVAVLGKVFGAGLPALLATRAAGATLIGVSMVPRAEIAMIVVERARQFGDWAVPPELYAAFVLISAATCILAPVTLEFLFRRWPEALKED
ncbi:cation:proton antiporter [Afifella pfennigii]|uniref:cation:proton antiporter n=1 Tax=Afifella pfennigii TaxID=209897 RepID=UPI00047C66CB|nr:cation:proton antiporter [Afifella pfennigii]